MITFIKSYLIRPSLVFLLLASSSHLMGEQITIGLSKQAPENQALERPARGMKKSEVILQFGEPKVKTPAAGSPPISSWQYDGFSVYFESDIVIHSVLKHQPKQGKLNQ